MNTDDGQLDFDVYFNNKQFNKAVDESEKRVKGFSSAVVAEGDKIDDAFKITAENLRIQRDVIAGLESDLKALDAQIKKVGPGKVEQDLMRQAAAVRAELQGEKDALTKLEAEFKKTETKARSFRTELRETREELIRMEQAGKRGTPEYTALQKKLGDLTDAMSDAQAQANVLANDEKGFQGVVSTMSGLTGAISAAQGAVGLFVGENENLNKIMLKVQSLMAITIGLQQVAVMLNKDSYFSIVVLTKAKEVWAAVNLKVATTLGISTVAAQALMATLTLGLSVAITAVVVLLSKLVSGASSARKELKAMNEAIADGAYKAVAAVEQLSLEYNALGDNMKAKEKFIDDNQERFKELGISITNVKDAENVFINNKDKFVESLVFRAKALAATDLATQKYKEALEKQLKLEKMPETTEIIYNDPATGKGKKYTKKNKDYTKLKAEQDELEKAGLDLFKKAAEFTAQEKVILADIGVSAENIVQGSIAEVENKITKLKEKLKNAATEKDRKELRKQIADYEKVLEKMDPKEKASLQDEKKKAEEELRKQMKEQGDLRRELTTKERETVIASMQDGMDKELEQLKFEHEQKLEEIRKYGEKLLEVQNEIAKQEWIKSGNKASDFKPSTDLNASDQAVIKSMTDTEKARYSTANEGVYDALLDKYKTFDDQKKDIDKAYFDEYARLLLLMTDENAEEIKGKIKVLKNVYKGEITDLQKSILKDFKLDGLLTDASGYIMDKVKEVLPFFHSISEASLSELKTIQGILNNIKIPDSVIEELKAKGVDVKLLEELINNLKKAAEEGSGQVETKILDKYVRAAMLFGEALSKSGDEFVQKMGGLVSQIGSTIGTVFSKDASGFDKASAIVGLAITVGNYLKSIREDKENKALNAQKKVTSEIAKQVSYETEINKLYEERRAMQHDSVFLGKDYAAVMSDAMSNISKYNTQLGETLSSLYSNAVFSADGEAKRRLFGTKTGTYEFSLLDILKNAQPKDDTQNTHDWLMSVFEGGWTSAIQAAAKGDWMKAAGTILDPAGIFGGYANSKARINAFENLSKSVSEALKAMGKSVSDFSTMSTQDMLDFFTLMEKSGNITDEGTKKLLASAKEQMEQIKKAQEEMKAAIGEIAGSIGQTIEDILEDSFRNGFGYGPEQAKKAATEISKILEDMLSNMIYQQAFAALYKDLQAGMEASFGANGDKSWIDEFKTFMSGIPAAAAMFNEGMTEAQKAAKAAGFDLWGKDTTKKSSLIGAAQALTEQTGSAIVGQANAMRINQAEALNVLRNSLLALNKIADNTSHLIKLNDILNALKSQQTDPLRGQGL